MRAPDWFRWQACLTRPAVSTLEVPTDGGRGRVANTISQLLSYLYRPDRRLSAHAAVTALFDGRASRRSARRLLRRARRRPPQHDRLRGVHEPMQRRTSRTR